jgi:hypothetical protein
MSQDSSKTTVRRGRPPAPVLIIAAAALIAVVVLVTMLVLRPHGSVDLRPPVPAVPTQLAATPTGQPPGFAPPSTTPR